jgi:hypothetical protein
MKISEEIEETIYKFEIDMTKEEEQLFINYAMDCITQEELDTLVTEWAMLDMLKRSIAEVLENKS